MELAQLTEAGVATESVYRLATVNGCPAPRKHALNPKP